MHSSARQPRMRPGPTVLAVGHGMYLSIYLPLLQQRFSLPNVRHGSGTISVRNKELEFVNSTVFLGINLDDRLQWGPHISVGKTSMVVRYIGKMFSRHISPTIGASFFTCKINLGDTRVKLQVWDTAGQERFRSMAPMYYRNANAALLVYDITSLQSYHAIKGWVRELKRYGDQTRCINAWNLHRIAKAAHLSSNVSEPLVLCVVGNKSDLEEERAVPAAEAAGYAASIGAQHYEASALQDQGIEQVFASTASSLVQLAAQVEAAGGPSGSLRVQHAYDEDGDPLPAGKPTEEDATHTGKVELPAWSIDSIAHGELQRSYLCC
ncbi:Ras-related protein Rab-21 [Eumeta japonica]|uniref:Ras-related protein Rab-21 n=1 Tax=Eumeta variegata TaxID=151549 RepID=A0A4C1V7Q6_EUMVA|nr:Ras-related protein Rab-21 [Eumeta japonica]